MKKIFLFIVLIISIQGFSQSPGNFSIVGIGTTSPDQLLSINASTGSNSVISFKQSGTSSAFVGIGIDGVFRNETESGTELQLRAKGASNIITLHTNSIERMRVASSGNVGIGTSSPDQLLSINAGTGANSLVSFKQNGTTTAVVGLGMDGVFRNETESGTELQLRAKGAGNIITFHTNVTERMQIAASGNVGIGTTPNTNAKLDVNGNIFSSGKIAIGTTDMGKISTYSLAVNGDAIFNKVKVELYGTWPDYVFKPNFKLTPLKELEKFIVQNSHLPEIPSEEEIQKNGIDLGQNQAILLKKIEELTLYIIEQNKTTEKLMEENKQLRNEIAEIKLLIQNKHIN